MLYMRWERRLVPPSDRSDSVMPNRGTISLTKVQQYAGSFDQACVVDEEVMEVILKPDLTQI